MNYLVSIVYWGRIEKGSELLYVEFSRTAMFVLTM
jgi:hypothetical protein